MNIGMYAGMQIVSNVNCVEQKITLSPDFKWITDEGRQSINNWFRETFGVRPAAYYMIDHAAKRILVAHPEIVEEIKQEAHKYDYKY